MADDAVCCEPVSGRTESRRVTSTLQVYTRRSREITPGGGVRGVVSYVKLYDRSATEIGKAVFVVVDLTLVAVQAWAAIRSLLPG